MKKTILTLGLNIVFTVSPVLAENLIDQLPPAFAETRNTYIKPFVGYGTYPTQVLYANTLNVSKLSNILPNINVFGHSTSQAHNIVNQLANINLEAQFKINHVLSAGIDVGKDINDYFGIASEIGYHHFLSSGHLNLTGKAVGTQLGSLNITAQLPALNVISCMLKPVINVIRAENFSFYVTGGFGVSYCMVLNPRDISVSMKDKLGDNKMANTLASDLLNTTNPQDVGQKLLDQVTIATLPNETIPALFSISWMLGAGLTIDVNDYTKLDIGYSYKVLGYFPTSKLFDGHIKDININCHSVHLGVRVYL